MSRRRFTEGLLAVQREVGGIVHNPALHFDPEELGADARRRFLEFFAVTIRNPHTRRTYARAAGDFHAAA
jgi:hypothetical protein